MDSKSGNDATDEQKGRIFGEYPNDEEGSSHIETTEETFVMDQSVDLFTKNK